ncbi:hypothetical protein KAX06_04885 [candidate division WOR-3 bacterium]|nr:hypothetical protein [candidate division WOR-3 bacterium]
MPTEKPTSGEIITSLKTLGFSVTRENDNQTTLSKGDRSVSIPQGSIPDDRERQLRQELEPIFSDPEHEERASASSSKVVSRVRDWLRESSR